MRDVFKPDSKLETVQEMETRITSLWRKRETLGWMKLEKEVPKLEAREAALRNRILALTSRE